MNKAAEMHPVMQILNSRIRSLQITIKKSRKLEPWKTALDEVLFLRELIGKYLNEDATKRTGKSESE